MHSDLADRLELPVLQLKDGTIALFGRGLRFQDRLPYRTQTGGARGLSLPETASWYVLASLVSRSETAGDEQISLSTLRVALAQSKLAARAFIATVASNATLITVLRRIVLEKLPAAGRKQSSGPQTGAVCAASQATLQICATESLTVNQGRPTSQFWPNRICPGYWPSVS